LQTPETAWEVEQYFNAGQSSAVRERIEAIHRGASETLALQSLSPFH
jgi:hypothetical protein